MPDFLTAWGVAKILVSPKLRINLFRTWRNASGCDKRSGGELLSSESSMLKWQIPTFQAVM